MTKQKEWECPGYLWADGDIPTCDYCATTIEDSEMFTCYYSGGHYCIGCEMEHANYILRTAHQIEVVT